MGCQWVWVGWIFQSVARNWHTHTWRARGIERSWWQLVSAKISWKFMKIMHFLKFLAIVLKYLVVFGFILPWSTIFLWNISKHQQYIWCCIRHPTFVWQNCQTGRVLPRSQLSDQLSLAIQWDELLQTDGPQFLPDCMIRNAQQEIVHVWYELAQIKWLRVWKMHA